jgi:integrase
MGGGKSTGAAGDGVYRYQTRSGVRWRFVFRRADGRLSSRRGYATRAVAMTARKELIQMVRADVRTTDPTQFDAFFAQMVKEKRAYLTTGALEDLESHGRIRLIPFFANSELATIDERDVREWLAHMYEDVETGELSAKTVNNARTWLAVVFNEAVRRRLMPRNPCKAVPRLPYVTPELDYLRVAEIDRYLDACAGHYRPLADFLIGAGARISEALALTWADVDLGDRIVQIRRQRPRRGEVSVPTKGKRARAVHIGPGLAVSLKLLRQDRLDRAMDDNGWIFLCPIPKRGRYSRRTEPTPPNRRTVHGWHEAALQRAELRDMPLHALRHTAAATWLSSGSPLIFVARQLGHRSITTTEEHYGHLETGFMSDAAARTEAAIAAHSVSRR